MLTLTEMLLLER